MTMNIEPCNLGDLRKLQEISYETFNATFKDQYSPENRMPISFNLEQLEKELTTISSQFFFVNFHNEVAGI